MPLPLAQVLGAVSAGLVGIALERTIIRHLYHRPLDSILATWGISLMVTQGMLVVLGSSWQGIGTPLGSFKVGDYTFSAYRLVLFGAAVGVLVGLYLVFMRTGYGVMARATMQNAAMARALGVRRPNACMRSASASAPRWPDCAARCTRRR